MAVVCVLSLNSIAALAQQNSSQTQEQKSKPASKPVQDGTLLVICDLACYWSVDRETTRHIEAGRSAKLKVMPGEHMVTATTEDGVDQVQQVAEVKEGKQKLVDIRLWPLRFARLEVEREAADEATRAEQLRQEQEKLAQRQEKEAAHGYWTDPETGLMWARTDSAEYSWGYAAGYCQLQRLAGHNDWRLPTIQELRGIYESSAKGGWHVKGNLHISGWHWSSTTEASGSETWLENFDDGREQAPFSNTYTLVGRVLCVRNPNE